MTRHLRTAAAGRGDNRQADADARHRESGRLGHDHQVDRAARLLEVTTKPPGRRTRRDSAHKPEKRHSTGGSRAVWRVLFGARRRKHAAHEPLISSVIAAEVPLAGLSLQPPHADAADPEAGQDPVVAEAVPKPPVEPGDGADGRLSGPRRLRVAGKHPEGRDEALPAGDRRGLPPSRGLANRSAGWLRASPARAHSGHPWRPPETSAAPVRGHRSRRTDEEFEPCLPLDPLSVRFEKATQKATQLLLAGGRRRSHRKNGPASKTQAAERLASSCGLMRPRAKEAVAPRVGLEPTTYRLTAGRSTIELSGIG
jgi:hypothetical protein